MTRALRLQFEGAFYHIMNRGLGNQNIFLNSNHQKLFLDLLSEITKKYKIEIHAYCLMNNHYHLLVKINLLNLDRAMKHLKGVYTIRFNRDVKRDGALFRGRYKSILLDKDSYFLNVSRYIHKNPSSAKIIEDDKKYVNGRVIDTTAIWIESQVGYFVMNLYSILIRTIRNILIL